MTRPFHESHGISQNLQFARVTRVPAHVDHNGRGGFVPGRGNAGWALYAFSTAAQAANFVATYAAAAMPCWTRYETINGELIQVR